MFLVDNHHLPLVAPASVAAVTVVSSIPSIALWHAQLGHASSSEVQYLASRGLLGSMSTENFDCVSCQLGKQPTLPFNTRELMSTDIFDLIHSDVWGLLLSLVLVDLNILLSLLMIILAIVGLFIRNIVLNCYKYIVTLQKRLKINFPNASKIFDLIILLNALKMFSKLFCIPMALFIT